WYARNLSGERLTEERADVGVYTSGRPGRPRAYRLAVNGVPRDAMSGHADQPRPTRRRGVPDRGQQPQAPQELRESAPPTSWIQPRCVERGERSRVVDE